MDQKELMAALTAAAETPVSHVDLSASTQRIMVDMDTRKITGHKEFGVIKDHLAENIIFEVKRYKGDTDLAEKHCAIHWENGKNGGVVPVTEIDLSEDGHILMRWELSDEFTQYAGSIAYALHFFSILDGGFTYHAATNAAVGTLGTTLNASAHSKNKITPSEIEVYIAKMNELSAAMDEQVVLAQEAATKAESIAEQLAEKIAKVEELTQKTEINKNDISKLSGEIENVEIEIRNDLYNVLGSKEVEILTDFEVAKNGKYLEYDTCIEKTYSSYYITVSYYVRKGTIIEYKIGTQETVVIAETDEEQTFYTAIAQYHKKGYCEGTYIAEKDMYVCFCILNTFSENKVTFTYVLEEPPIDNNMLNIDALGNNIEILHDNSYVDFSSGTIQSYQGFAVSKSYFVKKGCMVRYRVEVYGCAGFMETDETQSYYKVINGTNTTREVLEDIFYATKDMYVCFGWYKPFGHNSCAISNIESFDYDNVTPKMGNDGLNILVFGDSITDCTYIGVSDGKTTSYSFPSPSISYIENGVTHNYDKWAYLMQNYLPIKEVRCYAKSGAVYRDRMESESAWEYRQQLSEQINLAFNDLNNPNGVFNQSRFIPDYVIFALGINDRWDNISENAYENTIAKNVYSNGGELDVEATLNALDRTIFSDSIRWAYLKTKAKFPYAQFFTVLPLQTGNVNAENYIKVRELIERFAKHHSIKILDGGYEMGICSDFDLGGSVGLYLKDGLHPNEYGQNLYTKFIVNAIKSTYVKSDFLNR